MHGWATGGPEGEIPEWPFWSEMNAEQKQEYLDTALFELWIEGLGIIELKHFQWYNAETDGMTVVYYSEKFPPNTFESGEEYEFKGVWTIEFEGDPYSYSVTRMIIPTE